MAVSMRNDMLSNNIPTVRLIDEGQPVTTWMSSPEVNYPAAELRGIKIQNLVALAADTLYNDV